MYNRENNPHFLPTQQPHDQTPHDPNLRPLSHHQPPPRNQPQNLHPQQEPNLHILAQQGAPPHPHRQSRHKKRERSPRHGLLQPHNLNQQNDPQHRPSSPLRLPPHRKTKPITWFVAIFCTLFWIIIIIGGLAILIVYLAFRPRSPRFDVSSATLNAAYLDMGYLLNADLTLLANFTNPNRKMNANFKHIAVGLYYDRNLIAARFVEPIDLARRESKFADVHMVTSQVRLSIAQSQLLRRQIEDGRVIFEVRGLFHTRLHLGNFLKYSHWWTRSCTIVVSGPPGGVLIAKRC